MTKHLGSIPRLPTIWAELVLGLLYSRRPLEDELAVEPRPSATRFVPKGMVFDSPFFRYACVAYGKQKLCYHKLHANL